MRFGVERRGSIVVGVVVGVVVDALAPPVDVVIRLAGGRQHGRFVIVLRVLGLGFGAVDSDAGRQRWVAREAVVARLEGRHMALAVRQAFHRRVVGVGVLVLLGVVRALVQRCWSPLGRVARAARATALLRCRRATAFGQRRTRRAALHL